MRPDEIEIIVQGAVQKALAAAVEPAVQGVVTNGIDQNDRKEIREDLRHLRRWRKSVEQAQTLTFTAVIGTIATGILAAVWMGIKVYLGK